MSTSTTFPPPREADLLSTSLNFKTKITATPLVFSLTAAQATQYGVYHDAFASALAVANDDATRSPMNIELKNTAKKNLIAYLRLLAGIVQRAPTTTNAMRIDLGIPERKTEYSPIPIPEVAPALSVVSVNGRLIRVKMTDPANPSRRGLNPDIDGVAIFSFVGEDPPTVLSQYRFEGNIARATAEIEMAPTVPAFSKVWITAFYFNERKQSGPLATAISTYTGASIAAAA